MPPARTARRPQGRRPQSRSRRRSWAWRYRRLLFLTTLVTFTALAGTAYLLVRVPLPPENVQAQTTILTDSSGARLASLDAGENRESVALARVPKVVQQAVLAAEDKSFFDHSGIDPLAIARATWADVRGRGALQGGSTITQQYVKNVYLSQRGRTLWRKLREAVLAVKLERKYGKQEILERYLNTIYFGRGAYGVQAAAQAYFNKDVNELALPEASYLAGLIRSPEGADAHRAPDVATRRRARTLRAMQEAGAISATQRRAVDAMPVSGYVVERGKVDSSFALPDKGTQFFVEYVRQELAREFPGGTLYAGGLRVRTTLDLKLQAAAYDAVYGFLNRPDDPAGALVAVDSDGQVRAMVGGRAWGDGPGQSKVNLAVGREGGGSGRQPGSTFKPFVLATALKAGYSIESPFPAPKEVVFPKANRGRDYKVENFEGQDFGPSVSLLEATRNSVNTVYAQAIKSLGAQKVVDFAHQAGIASPLSADVSLALGTSEVSVLELASGYNTFANRGEFVRPRVIEEVRTADGRVLRPARPPERSRVLERRHADIVNWSLQQAVQRGTGTAAQFGKPLAGKTGTTQDFGDAWFVGYTPKLTVAVWMGFPEGNTRKMTSVRGRSVNGGSFPATLFKRFMQVAAKGVDSGAFAQVGSLAGRPLTPPKGVVLSTTTTSTSSTSTTVPAAPSTTTAPSSTTTTSAPATTTSSTSTTTTTAPPR